MTIGTDFEVQNDKDIRYIGAAHGASGAGYYTVLELHRWAQGLADDAAAAGDDFLDMTTLTPSERAYDTIITMLNGYNIDDTAAEHLYGGSIIQASGDTIYDGIVVIANEGCNVQIVQNGAIITNDFWNSLPDGESLTGLNRDVANGIACRFILKVRSSGSDIDGRRLLCQTREWGKTYSEFKINGTARGNNVAALNYADDLNNATLIATIAGYTDIVNGNEGYIGLDVDNDTTDEYYYSEWDRVAHTINDLYERMKWLSRRETSSTLYGLNGELFRGITHDVAIASGSGTWVEPESLSWSGGTGQLIAVDNTTGSSTTELWLQLLTGVAPTAAQTITGNGAATGVVSGTPTERVISTPFCGVSTGSSLIGAYGFCLEVLDLGASDKVFDLTNTLYQAPNYVTFTVSGLVGDEDYVLVTNDESTGIDFDQFTLNGALTGGAVTSVVVNEAIPADTPATGTIRIERDSGKYTRHPYSAWNSGTKTFTITSHDFSSDNASNGNNTFISYIDELVVAPDTTLDFTSVYSAPRTLFIRVRDGGTTPIKTFETTGTLGAAGGSTTATRTSDA